MSDCWVIVADGALARFMVLEQRTDAPARGALRLVESVRMSNPDHTVKGRRDARKIKSGRDTGRGTLAPHGYTDHRDSHESELLRRFASRIVERAATLVSAGEASTLVLVAEPRMLGILRAAVAPVARAGLTLRELAHDYTWCSVTQVYRKLAQNGVLPPARRAAT